MEPGIARRALLSIASAVCFVLWLTACTTTTQPGASAPPEVQTQAKQEDRKDKDEGFKMGIGNPDPHEETNTDLYEKRDQGVLDNKAFGIKHIWKF